MKRTLLLNSFIKRVLHGFEKHLKGIERLLQTIRNAGLKLSVKKCQSSFLIMSLTRMV